MEVISTASHNKVRYRREPSRTFDWFFNVVPFASDLWCNAVSQSHSWMKLNQWKAILDYFQHLIWNLLFCKLVVCFWKTKLSKYQSRLIEASLHYSPGPIDNSSAAVEARSPLIPPPPPPSFSALGKSEKKKTKR